MAVGLWALYQIPQKAFAANGVVTITKAHFGGSAFPLSKIGFDTTTTVYAGMLAVLVNVVVCGLATLLLRGRVADGVDSTDPSDYTAEAGDPGVRTDLEEMAH